MLHDIAGLDDPAILFLEPVGKGDQWPLVWYYGKLLNGGVWSDFVLSSNVKGLDAVFEQVRSQVSINPRRAFEDPQAVLANRLVYPRI